MCLEVSGEHGRSSRRKENQHIAVVHFFGNLLCLRSCWMLLACMQGGCVVPFQYASSCDRLRTGG